MSQLFEQVATNGSSRPESTPEDLAMRWGLKLRRVKGKKEWYGPNPLEPGATDDGFWLNENGWACDRKLSVNGKPKYYPAAEVARLSGITNYAPVIEWREANSPGQKRTKQMTTTSKPKRDLRKTWVERGITEKTLKDFEVKDVDDGWEYPTYFSNGQAGRKRWKSKHTSKPKYMWRGAGERPVGFGLDKLYGAGDIWIVGGEPDVMAMFQCGFAAVATFGEGQGHEELISELAHLNVKNVNIALDNDETGRTGTLALVDACHCEGVHATAYSFVGAPGYDICDLFEEMGHDVERFRQAIESLLEVDEQTLAKWRLGEQILPATRSPRVQIAQRKPVILSAVELMQKSLPPQRWAVTNFVGEGVTIIAGVPKSGKSWLALDIAIAVAMGEDWIETWPTEKGEVLYLALEDTERRLQDRLRRVRQGEHPPEGLHLAIDWPALDKGGLQELETWISQHPQARLIIVDTFKKVRPTRTERDYYGEDYDHISQLKSLADQHQVAILVVHHTTKQPTDDPLKSVSGTMGLTGAADGIIVLSRERLSEKTRLFVTGRDVEEQVYNLHWCRETFTWTYLEQEQSEPRVSHGIRTSLDVLATHFSRGATHTEWKQACIDVGMSKSTFDRARNSLYQQGLVVQQGTGRGATFHASSVDCTPIDEPPRSTVDVSEPRKGHRENRSQSHASIEPQNLRSSPDRRLDTDGALVPTRSRNQSETNLKPHNVGTKASQSDGLSFYSPIEGETLNLFEDEVTPSNIAWT